MTPQSRTDPMPGNRKLTAQELADRAHSARRKGEALSLARQALELDGECTDAQIILAQEEAGSPKELAAQLKIVVDRAEARLGTPFLSEHRGRLGEIAEAGPYLRARLALASALERAGRPAQAVPHLSDLLANDPADRLGARFRMVRCLLAAKDLKSLSAFLDRWEDGSSSFMAWAAVLERIHSRSEKGAQQALQHARAVNPHFEEYLTGKRRMPRGNNEKAAPGSPEEAAAALRLFGEAWANDREGMYWLFKHE